MELFNILFVIVLFLTFTKGKNEEQWSARYFNIIKGVSILMVFICHLSKEYHGIVLYKIFCSFGAIAVPTFFFVSGYGLMYNWKNRPGYADEFLKKRVLPIILNYAFTCALYFFLKGCKSISWLNLILCNYYIPFSWFIFAITLLYLLFYIAIKSTRNQLVAIGIVGMLLSIYLCMKQVLQDIIPLVGENLMYAFVFGMILPAFPNIKNKLNRLSWNKTLFSSVIISYTVLWLVIIGNKYLHLNLLLIELGGTIGGILSPFIAILILGHLKIKRFEEFWIFLQQHSLQIYLLHGIVLYTLEQYKIVSSEIWVFILFFITLATSYCLRKITKYMMYYV